jgi:hypothetical protein
VQLFLLQHYFSIAAQVGEMAATLDRRLGHGAVVVVRDGTHDCSLAGKRCMHRRGVGHVEPQGSEPPTPVTNQELWQLLGPKIGERHQRNCRILQQIVGAGAALETGTEDQQFHQRTPLEWIEKSPGR